MVKIVGSIIRFVLSDFYLTFAGIAQILTTRYYMALRRQSNMELLRIISMLMVLTLHADGAALGVPTLEGNLSEASAYDLWRLAIESMAIIGVNCFTMISGYFGIRLRWRSAAAFLFQCVFYAVLIYSLRWIFFPGGMSWEGWVKSWLVLTHTDLWYVPAYFGLMLLCPVLNAGLEALSRRQYAWLLAVFTLFNVWCGWFWHGSFNPSGYTLVQLIMVYMIARFIRLHVSQDAINRRRPAIIAVYLLSTAGIFVCSLYFDTASVFAYNSPLVLLSTVSLFLIFTTLRIQSRFINYAARSAFAAYLIHKSPQIWVYEMKPLMLRLEATLPGWQLTLAGAGVVLGFYLLAMAVDPLRRALSRALLKKA